MRIQFEALRSTRAPRAAARERPVEISPKAFALLGLLLGNRHRVSSTTASCATGSGPRATSRARASRGSSPRSAACSATTPGRPRFVRNVHGLGYAFCGEAARRAERQRALAMPQARLSAAACVWGAHEIGLREGENLIGRTPECVDSHRLGRRCRATTRASSSRTARRRSRTWAARTGRSSRAGASTGRAGSRTARTVCVGPALSDLPRGLRPRIDEDRLSASMALGSPAGARGGAARRLRCCEPLQQPDVPAQPDDRGEEALAVGRRG